MGSNGLASFPGAARALIGAAGLALATLCASPLHAQTGDDAAEPPRLRSYALKDIEVPAAPSSSIADLILAVDSLPGSAATVERGRPARACPTATSERTARLRCELLGQAADLLRVANSSSVPPKLDTLDIWIDAGRYDMGSRFYQLADRYGATHVQAIRDELNLSSLDYVQHAFRKFDRNRLKARSTRISFVSGGGSFTFEQGAITIDTLGMKRLIVADFLFGRKAFVALSDCLSSRWANARAEIFCNNLLERTRALEGMDIAGFKPAKPGTDRVIGAGGTVADLIADWREWYGLSYAEAYFDEVWNYLSALSLEAARRGPRAVCSSACAGDAAAYVGGPRDSLLRQMKFVIAHELSHQLLGHADMGTASASTDEERCVLAHTLETQADIFGVLLTRGVDPALGSDNGALGPFFDGYVALFESRRFRCGYFSGQARHIIFEVFSTDASWSD